MIKKLVSHLGAYKRAAILTPIISALEAVMDVLLPTIMAFIIDQGIEKGDMNAVIKYGLLTFLVAAIALLLGVLAGKFAAEASTGLAGNLRDAMYENIQHFSFSNIDKYSTAGLVTRMTTDVTNVQNAFQMIERMCVRAPVHLVFALLMASAISGTLSLVFVVAIVFLVAVLASIMIPTFKIFDRVFKNYDNLNASVQENISAIRVVKSFVREHFENEKYTTACESLYKQFVSAESRLSFNNPAMLISVYGCNIALSWFGAHYVLNGSITTGQLNALFGYIMNILMALMMLSMAFVMISMSASSARRIVEVLDETTDLPAPKAPVDTVADGSISFDHVTFKYKHGSGQPVLNDITFTIRPGETLGIIGGTGSAKSSLVQLIPACTTRRPARSRSAAWMSAITTSTCSAARSRWCCKRTSCSPAPSSTTCAGAMRTPARKSASGWPSWPAPMNSSSASPTSTIPGSSRAARTFPAARSSA